MARAYIAIASGSPCVVPSREVMYSPPMNNLAGLQLVLVRMGAKVGHRTWTFRRAASLLSGLKAFPASARRTASTSASSTMFPKGFRHQR